jgi:hypothetical protein
MFWAISLGRVAAMPKTEAPRYAPYGRRALRVCARKSAIDFSALPVSPGKVIDEIGPSGRRT